MKDEHDGRPARALAFAAVPAVLAALLVGGVLGIVVPPAFALAVSLMGAPVAGVLIGEDNADKVFSTLAAMFSGACMVSGTMVYVASRRAMVDVELLLPIALGAAPGLGAFYAFRALTPRPLARTLVAFAMSVATVALVAAS